MRKRATYALPASRNERVICEILVDKDRFFACVGASEIKICQIFIIKERRNLYVCSLQREIATNITNTNMRACV